MPDLNSEQRLGLEEPKEGKGEEEGRASSSRTVGLFSAFFPLNYGRVGMEQRGSLAALVAFPPGLGYMVELLLLGSLISFYAWQITPDPDYVEKTWQALRSAICQIQNLRNENELSYEELYRYTYNLILHKVGPRQMPLLAHAAY